MCQDRKALQRVAALKDYTTICSSAPSEILAIMCLQNADALARTSMAIVAGNVQLADAFFEQHRDVFQWNPPRAGSIAFPRRAAARTHQ